MKNNKERRKGGENPPDQTAPTNPTRLRTIANIAEAVQLLIDTSDKFTNENNPVYASIIKSELQEITDTLDGYDRPRESRNTLEKILENTEQIKKSLEGTKNTPRPRPTITRRDREIKEREQVKNTGLEALSAIRKEEPKKATEDIITVRHLLSGNLLFTPPL